MRPIIEFCLSNLASGSQEAMEMLEKDPNLDIIEYGCLNHCGQCALAPFALVNGEFISAETNEELVDQIYEYLEENPMF